MSGSGTGITWSGEIALSIDPSILKKFSSILESTILIAGTNGKTTTSSMIAHVLSSHGFSVIHNNTGANLANGIVGTLLSKKNSTENSIGVFETDEASLEQIAEQMQPQYIVLLNLFRDQLDRYGEVDVIAERWINVLKKVSSILIANADDPLIVSIAERSGKKVVYFGLQDASLKRSNLQHASDSTYCQKCGSKLSYNAIYLSHLGDWYCEKCGWKRPVVDFSRADSPLVGVYNKYNTLAATLTSKQFKISNDKIKQSLEFFSPVFGRLETFQIENKTIKIILSKNPTGFNESLRTVIDQKDAGCILLALNDRIPDGTDVSWIWDADFEMLSSSSSSIPIICTGDRVYDLGLTLKYSIDSEIKGSRNQNNIVIEENLKKALFAGLEKVSEKEIFYILPTYSAMLDVRKLLTGKKIS